MTDKVRRHYFRYQRFHIDKTQPIGRGAYGAVYKAKCDQLPSAAKILYQAIVDPRDPGAGKIMDRFGQECAFLECVEHPNIVQYLGVTTDPESKQPVLLMELLDESLTKMLERSQLPLPFCIQVDICHDVSLAVAYLHSNDIIHRDLSSNNVLIIARKRAKVTDFGMSKFSGTTSSLTVCPGTLAYMSPEALREPPKYEKQLDCFSEGVLMIQVCTRKWPEPGPRTEIIQDSRSRTGVMEMPVPEIERRKSHIDLIDPTHPLLSIAQDCIKYRESERPSSEELCQRLAGLKESNDYRNKTWGTTVPEELQDKDELCQEYRRALQEKDCRIEQQSALIAEKERQIQQLSQQLLQYKKTGEEGHQSEKGQRQIFQKHGDQENKAHPPTGAKKHLSWKDGGKAPFVIVRGAAAIGTNVSYYMNWDGKVCSYNSIMNRWIVLPRYPYRYGSLAVVSGQLTAIGGCKDIRDAATYTPNLFSTHVSHSYSGWSGTFPPMPTKRRSASAAATDEHLIVAGGTAGPLCRDNLATVEVMDINAQVWSTVSRLPHPYDRASATICGNRLYLAGGWHGENKTKSVLTCSVSKLLRSSSSSETTWHQIADAPVYCSTCVTVNGELLAVGGCDTEESVTPAIHKYNSAANSWHHISSMPTPRWHCLCAHLPTNELMVVGGNVSTTKPVLSDKVEIAIF